MVPDVADLTGTYRASPTTTGRRPSSRRRRGVLIVVVVVALALSLGIAIVARTFPWTTFAYGLAWTAVLILQRRRPRQTVVDADALVVRASSITRARRLPWEDVLAIRVQGRWDLASTAIVRAGAEATLPGVTPEIAARLADAVAVSRPGAEPPASRVGAHPTAAPHAARRPLSVRMIPTSTGPSSIGPSSIGPSSPLERDAEWDGPFRRSRPQH